MEPQIWPLGVTSLSLSIGLALELRELLGSGKGEGRGPPGGHPPAPRYPQPFWGSPSPSFPSAPHCPVHDIGSLAPSRPLLVCSRTAGPAHVLTLASRG